MVRAVRRWRLIAALAITAAVLGAAPLQARGHGAPEAVSDSAAARWGYSPDNGLVPPEHWGELPGCALCARGHHQSPIALNTTGELSARPAPIAPLTFAYHQVPLSVLDNRRFISIVCDSAGVVSLVGTDTPLRRIDIHAPSEHSLDGKTFPLE
ncbi:MAG: hypothetical protein ACRDL7_04535, partial [Gaiellaceae bacterium]